MNAEQMWAKTTARRVVAETLPVNQWKRNEVRALAAREQVSDDRGNRVVRGAVTLADIMGYGFVTKREGV